MASPPRQIVDGASQPLAEHASAPMREFLIWVVRCPRSYEDAMDAWQSHCPRFTVWEDALAAELIEIVGGCGNSIDAAGVQLTPRGCAVLAGS